METLGAHVVVERLVNQHPAKAVDILVRCCQDHSIHNEIVTFLLQPKNMQYGVLNAANALNALGPPPSTSHLDSQQSRSPTNRQRLPLRTPPTTRPMPPLSPATTASSSSKSLSSKDGTEYLFVLTIADRVVKEEPVRMRTAPIEYSVIREDVVYERLFRSASISPVPGERISLPCPGVSGDMLISSFWTELTWRRPDSDPTHKTAFYLVPRRLLDIDVLLGYRDSGEDFQPAVSPQPQRVGQGLNFEEFIRQPAPTPPAPSYHRSSMMYDGSTSATPVQPQNIVEAFLNRQHGAAMGSSSLPQHSPATTQILSSQEHPPPHRSTAAPSPSASNVNHTPPTDKIRLNCVWGPTPINVWLDLDATGEAFFDTVQPLFEKRKGIFDRAVVTILLKTDRQAPDAEGYPLSLDEEALEADWEETVRWLREHKRERPPHLFGRVELDEG